MKKTLTLLLILWLAACSSPNPAATPVAMTAVESTVVPEGKATVDSIQTGMPVAVPTALKYRILEQFPDFFFCDPDYYPVARDDESVLAQQRFPELQTNQEEFQAILDHVGFHGTADFTAEQKLTVYREHKRLNAIHFEAAGDRYKFQIQTGLEGQQGLLITGAIDRNGSIEVLQSEQGFPSCPICLAAGTWIDTPRGAVRVEELEVGDPIWTATEAGDRVSGTILRVGSVRVPANHRVVHIRLSDGRELWASAGHPTADSRVFADLQVHDPLDGAQITQIEILPYTGTVTYDVLPSGDTGFYWANGVLIGSTLTNGR